jgi:hypothetical protein
VADLRSKTLTYLRDQKVHVLHARTPADQRRPVEVVAVVEGHTGVRRVELRGSVWTCNCTIPPETPALLRGTCAHRAAVQMVTNHPSAAAKPEKASAAA